MSALAVRCLEQTEPPVVPTIRRLATLSATELQAFGLSDESLSTLAQVTIQEEWVPATTGPCAARMRMFQRVTSAI